MTGGIKGKLAEPTLLNVGLWIESSVNQCGYCLRLSFTSIDITYSERVSESNSVIHCFWEHQL